MTACFIHTFELPEAMTASFVVPPRINHHLARSIRDLLFRRTACVNVTQAKGYCSLDGFPRHSQQAQLKTIRMISGSEPVFAYLAGKKARIHTRNLLFHGSQTHYFQILLQIPKYLVTVSPHNLSSAWQSMDLHNQGNRTIHDLTDHPVPRDWQGDPVPFQVEAKDGKRRRREGSCAYSNVSLPHSSKVQCSCA
jgi:hypothetical protein